MTDYKTVLKIAVQHEN